jgi:prefoldin subunit 5
MRAFTAVLTLAILLLSTSVATASAVKTPPPGVPETLAVSFLPDGTTMVWYHVAYPIEALEETAQLVAKTKAEGATLTILVTPSTEIYPTQLVVYGQNLDVANASAIATAFGKSLDIPLKSNTLLDGYTTYTATIDSSKLARLIEELRPQTREGGFSPHVNMGFLKRFQWAQVFVEILKTGWGVSISFQVRAYNRNVSANGDAYSINIIESLGVSELKPSRGAFLNLLFIPPPSSKLVSYRVSPRELNASSITYSIESLYVQLHGDLYLREFVVEFKYQPISVDNLIKQLAGLMNSVEKIEELSRMQNGTSNLSLGKLAKTGKQPFGGVLGEKNSRDVVNITAALEPKAVGETEVHGGGWGLPQVFSLENMSRIDPPTILLVTPLASALMIFTVVCVRGGPRRASKGAAAVTLAIMLLTSTVTPLLTVRAVQAEQAGGGLESLLEVEQYIPEGAPQDLEISLLFPAFKYQQEISRTFIIFKNIVVLATPSLRAPYKPEGLDGMLAGIGIDKRFIELVGIVLSSVSEGNPLKMFKELTIKHKATSAFIPHEDVGANVYIVFQAKPSEFLKLILRIINIVFLIGYSLLPIPILNAVGAVIVSLTIGATIALSLIVPHLKIYVSASYPTSVENEGRVWLTAWGFRDGVNLAEKRVWLSEERYLVSLPITIMILTAATPWWNELEKLLDILVNIPLTASLHVSSDADSGWTLTSLLGVYSGNDRGLKVWVDFKDAVGIGGKFEKLLDWFKEKPDELVKETARPVDEISKKLSDIMNRLNDIRNKLDESQNRLNKFKEKSDLIKRVIEKIEIAKGEIESAKGNIDSAKRKVDGARENIKCNVDKIDEVKEDINSAKEDVASAIEHLNNAKNNIESAKQDLVNFLNSLPEPSEEEDELEELRNTIKYVLGMLDSIIVSLVKDEPKEDPGILNQIKQIKEGLNKFYDKFNADGVRKLCELKAPEQDTALKPISMTLTYIVLPATPLVTEAVYSKGQTMLKLRAYYGWNPMPQIAHATAVKVREAFEIVREMAYNKFPPTTSAIRELAVSLETSMEGVGIGDTLILKILEEGISSVLQTLKDELLLISKEISEQVRQFFENKLNNILNEFNQKSEFKELDNILKSLGSKINELSGLDESLSKVIEFVNKIINTFFQPLIDTIDHLMHVVLPSIINNIKAKLDIIRLPISDGRLKIGSLISIAAESFTSGLLSKDRGTVLEAVRKLNGVEREILGMLIKARDATTYLSSMIRIPILGREGKLQATIIGLGSSTVSDEDGYLGTIVIPHSQLRSVAGWYNEYPLVLHPAGLIAPIPADYSLVSPEIEELRDSLGAAPPSVLWVKVNEVGPVLKGGRIEIAILGDPTRPSAPHGTKILVYRHDGSVEKKNLGDLPFIGSSKPSSVGGGFAPYIPFPIGQQSLKGLDALEPGSLMVSYYVSVFEEPVEDPSARAVPRILVPADTATGTVLVIPYLPFPQPAS